MDVIIISTLKDKLNEAYSKGNFALRWAGNSNNVAAL
jgi:hypothetical protein